MEDLTNTLLRGYQVREILGTGGFGVVYLAYQPVIDRDVAIKAILPEYANAPEFVRRFAREAQYIARLEHPHIVPIYDFWRDPKGAYIVMRFYRGSNLGVVLHQEGPWSLADAGKLIEQVGAALAIAHTKNIIHQDIKPENILLDEHKNGYLTDFGIAKDLSNVGDTGYEVYGSPAYISPEHARGGGVSKQSDIYSFGLLTYALLVGESPFMHESVAKMLNQAKYAPVPSMVPQRPGLHPSADEVIQNATRKNADERYDNVIDFVNDFMEALAKSEDLPVPERPSHNASSTTDLSDDVTTSQAFNPSSTVPLKRPSTDTKPFTMPVTPTGFDSLIDTAHDIGSDPVYLAQSQSPNPYVGLRAFEETDAYYFHGRTNLIDKLVQRLAENVPDARFLAVVGASGSGKSSVIKAGLIPALRYGVISGSDHWFISTMVPGTSPLKDLEQAVLRIAYNPPESPIEKAMRTGTKSLDDVLQELMPETHDDLLLVVDQFEEIFVLADEQERQIFLDNLVAAVRAPKSKLHLVITLRADFYDRPLLIPGLGDLIRSRTEVVLPLTTEELEQAIEGPAINAQLEIHHDLLETIVADVHKQPGGLPLLQFALTELFDRREGNTLTKYAYMEIGGVSGALARRADELYDQLDAIRQSITRQLFLRLVAAGREGKDDTRRRALQSELLSINEDTLAISAILDLFGRFRLLTFDRDPESRVPTVEIAHEALIRQWHRLHDWLEASRDALRTQEQLRRAMQEWHSAKQDTSYLATGSRLAQFEILQETDSVPISDSEREYLNASIRQRQRAANRVRLFIAVLAITTVVALGMAVFAFDRQAQARAAQATAVVERDRANEQANISRSRELALSALDARNRFDTALLFDVQALNSADTVQARSSLLADLQSHSNIQTVFAGDEPFFAMARSEDRLAAADEKGTVYLWDLATHQSLAQFAGSADSILDVAFSPDGSWLATADEAGNINLWSANDPEQTPVSLNIHEAAVRSIAFSPDGRWLASGEDTGKVMLSDISQTEPTSTLLGSHADSVYALAFSRDGQKLASGGADNNIFLWDLSEPEPVAQVLRGHENWVLALTFNDNVLASAGIENRVLLWDANSGDLLGSFNPNHADWIWSVAFSPSGTLFATASADNTVKLWDLSTGQRYGEDLDGHTDAVRDVVFTPDGKGVLTASQDSSTILWTLEPEPRLFTSLDGHTEAVWTVTAGDGFFASAGGDTSGSAGDFAIRVWHSPSSDEDPLQLNGHSAPVLSVVSDGSHLFSGSADGEIRVWDSDGTLLASLHQDTGIRALAADANQLISADDGGNLIVWKQTEATWQPVQQWHGHEQAILGLALNPEGNILASASQDNTVRLWDVETGQALGDPLAGHTDEVQSVAFSPDGRILASGAKDNTVRLWDVESQQPMGQPLEFHTNWVNSVAFSPDGSQLASASRDHTIMLWDVATRQPIRPALIGHPDWVTSIAFRPDGTQLISGSFNGDVFLWDVSVDSWREIACRIANRNFSQVEWARLFIDEPYRITCSG